MCDVDAFLTTHAGQWSRISMATNAKALRAFFRYAETRDWCRAGISQAIESPRIFKEETLPRGPSWEQVQQLLASKDANTARDIRDHAILLLFAVYGLRRSEVAGLCLDHLDWAHDTLRLYRSKQRRTQLYPLHPPVMLALIRYLQEVRPSSPYRHIFLTLKAPVCPISPSGLSTMVSACFTRVGLTGQPHGPHALRHACATHLINSGSSMKEIGDHLGHRDLSTTRIYAKVDMTGLREVANFDTGGLL